MPLFVFPSFWEVSRMARARILLSVALALFLAIQSPMMCYASPRIDTEVHFGCFESFGCYSSACAGSCSFDSALCLHGHGCFETWQDRRQHSSLRGAGFEAAEAFGRGLVSLFVAPAYASEVVEFPEGDSSVNYDDQIDGQAVQVISVLDAVLRLLQIVNEATDIFGDVVIQDFDALYLPYLENLRDLPTIRSYLSNTYIGVLGLCESLGVLAVDFDYAVKVLTVTSYIDGGVYYFSYGVGSVGWMLANVMEAVTDASLDVYELAQSVPDALERLVTASSSSNSFLATVSSAQATINTRLLEANEKLSTMVFLLSGSSADGSTSLFDLMGSLLDVVTSVADAVASWGSGGLVNVSFEFSDFLNDLGSLLGGLDLGSDFDDSAIVSTLSDILDYLTSGGDDDSLGDMIWYIFAEFFYDVEVSASYDDSAGFVTLFALPDYNGGASYVSVSWYEVTFTASGVTRRMVGSEPFLSLPADGLRPNVFYCASFSVSGVGLRFSDMFSPWDYARSLGASPSVDLSPISSALDEIKALLVAQAVIDASDLLLGNLSDVSCALGELAGGLSQQMAGVFPFCVPAVLNQVFGLMSVDAALPSFQVLLFGSSASLDFNDFADGVRFFGTVTGWVCRLTLVFVLLANTRKFVFAGGGSND